MSEHKDGSSGWSIIKDTEKSAATIAGLPVEEFTKNGFKTLMESLKVANSLPTGRDRDFYTTFESFKTAMHSRSNNIISNMNSILRKNEVGGSMRNNVLENKTEILVEACDVILERVANNIDEMNGIRKSEVEPVVFQTVSVQLPVNGSWNRPENSGVLPHNQAKGNPILRNTPGQTIRLITAENILRPQTFFKDKIDNRRNVPWEPRIKEKPNSLKPLAIFLEETEFGEEYSHPYEFELDRFQWSDENLRKGKVITPKPLQDTPLVEIDKPEQLDCLVEELRQFREIAVDLEHHSYRSFMGITCLMQISTPDKDYLIDTLALRDKLYVLNEIFTDPKTVKVFHGAQSDIEWLQRDLSLYVVNMFDTHLAARQLEYTGLSLAHLLQRFCNFTPNKQFQLADWRIRPLPDELKSYAREDTHYLIYVYQKMRNELIDRANGQSNLLKAVVQGSTQLCKRRYLKPRHTDESHLKLYRRCNRMFDNRQLFALKELYKWRDQISRDEDESPGYVLPNNMLLEISDRIPREMQGILACCNPVPPLVRANLLELHKLILKALEKPFELPILKEDTRARGATSKVSKVIIDSPLHCPHDLTKTEQMGDNLPTLLGGHNLEITEKTPVEIEANCSACSIYFNSPENLDNEGNITKTSSPRVKKFLSPFARYKLIKPFIQARETKLAEEKNRKQQEENAAKDVTGSNCDQNDAQRIQAIKEHFLELNKRTEEQRKALEDAELALSEKASEMAHTINKRKRDDALEENCAEPEIKKLRFQQNIFQKNNKKGKKRKKKNQDRHEQSFDNQKNQGLQGQSFKKQKNQNHQGQSLNKQKNSQDKIPNKNRVGPSPNRQQNNKNKEKHSTPRNNQGNPGSNTNVTPYDYSMVDFRQFGGGAGSVQNHKPFKAKFKARGKKTNNPNKGQNKQMM